MCLVFLAFTALTLVFLHIHVLLGSIRVLMDSHLVKFVQLAIIVSIQLSHLYLVHQEPSVFLEVLSVWLVLCFKLHILATKQSVLFLYLHIALP